MIQSYSPGSHCQQDQMGLISSNPEIQMVDSLYETTGNREFSEVLETSNYTQIFAAPQATIKETPGNG